MIIKRCKGCGAILQAMDANKPGYIPVLKEDSTTCKRCYRMIHYNELPKIVAKNEDYEKVIDQVTKEKALMVYIVDIFSFQSTFIPMMIDRLRDKDVILVANKIDLLPKSTNLKNVVEWISKQCQRRHFKVLAVGVASAKKGSYMEDLISLIDAARKERDVYFVGCANVGKSSIINALLKSTMNQSNDVIATSIIPGTTLNQIRIPYFIDNRALIDTPGLISTQDKLVHLLPVSYQKMVPNNELKPITFQIQNENSIFLGGLASINFKLEGMVPVTIYMSPNIYLHRCKTARVEELWHTQLGKLLVPPTVDEVLNIKYHTIKLKITRKKMVWFSGFGFILIHRPVELTIKLIENTEVYVSDAFIGIC